VRPLPPPQPQLIGNYSIRQEIVSDSSGMKLLKYKVEGRGELSTFEWEQSQIPGAEIRTLSGQSSAEIRGESLASTKSATTQVTSGGLTTAVVLPQIRILQFDPGTERRSILTLPSLSLHFSSAAEILRAPVIAPAIRRTNDPTGWILWVAAALSFLAVFRIRLPGSARRRAPKLRDIFGKNKPDLQISRNAAQALYQQLMLRIAKEETQSDSLVRTVKAHLPRAEWMAAEHAFRRLEWNAFSQSRAVSLTYGEMKNACARLEKTWEA